MFPNESKKLCMAPADVFSHGKQEVSKNDAKDLKCEKKHPAIY